MKGINTVYYLLFVLLIMGAFAAMAQNVYGLYILGGVGIAFALVFLFQLLRPPELLPGAERLYRMELTGLLLLAAVIELRVFNLQFAALDALLITGIFLLLAVYSVYLVRTFRLLRTGSFFLATGATLFYGVAIAYLLTLLCGMFLPWLTVVFGSVAIALLLVFAGMAFFGGRRLVAGESRTLFGVLGTFRNKVLLFVGLFFLFTVYVVLTRGDVLPKIYSDQLPRTYFGLIDQAEAGKDKPVNGKYKFQVFKQGYDQFLKNSRNRE